MGATTEQRVACAGCDLLLTVPELRDGQRAVCPRCEGPLAARPPDPVRRPLAFALAAIVLLSMANAQPFLALESRGLENVMTLPEAALELRSEGHALLALVVFSAIVLVPAAVLAVLLGLLVPLLADRPAPWLVGAGRLLFRLSPWSMAEVFIIGVIVSLVKISDLAQVSIGASFWAYAGFAVCLTAALASLDRWELWRRIDRCAT